MYIQAVLINKNMSWLGDDLDLGYEMKEKIYVLQGAKNLPTAKTYLPIFLLLFNDWSLAWVNYTPP